jgi:hypothetical protein
MSDVADRISDHDDAEAARILRVGAKSNVVFWSLFNALGKRVSKYNERHPQGFGFPNAVFMNEGPFSSREYSLKIQKNTEPRSLLTLDFPINSGAMQFELSAKTGKRSGSLTLDVVNDTPTYCFQSEQHSAESLADLLLEPVLSSSELPGPGRKFGFRPA